jgi:hypothetical protein
MLSTQSLRMTYRTALPMATKLLLTGMTFDLAMTELKI